MKKLIISTPLKLLFCFVILNLIIGIFIAQDFGKSTDEYHEFRTANVALGIYTGEIKENLKQKYENLGHDQYYGTASTTVISFIEEFFFPNRDHATKVVAHYVYFVFFQASVIGIFLLAKYFFDDWISLGIAILFGTQPLLFGHAFINPKDIPILTTFLFTVVTGFSMVDSWIPNVLEEETEPSTTFPWKITKGKKVLLVSIIFISLLLLLWCGPWITKGLLQLVEYSYKTKGMSFFGKMFAFVTTYGSLEGYLALMQTSVLRIYRWVGFGTPFLLLFLFFYCRKYNLFGNKVNFILLLAATFWGFAVSTRVLSITAGGLVGIYALLKSGKESVFPLIIYTLTASIISYFTWPFIWIFGFRGYLESLTLFQNFPWSGLVLFEGKTYNPTELPARFLPKLMALQFTEPLVILTLTGLIISLYMLIKRKTDPLKLTLLLTWFFVPLFYIIIEQPTLYSNFRHFLFILPPLFVFTGFSLQLIASFLDQKRMILGISLLLCIPGLVSIVKIHPFEYIYYNSFIEGIKGANNQFELDYWTISYKNAMDFVNENIPPGSRILVWKNNSNCEIYAKQNFLFASLQTTPEQDYQNFEYIIIPPKALYSQEYFEKLPVEFSIEVDYVSLMVIKKIPVPSD